MRVDFDADGNGSAVWEDVWLEEGWLAREVEPLYGVTVTEISSSWTRIERRRTSWRERWLTLPWWRGRIYGLRQRLADWIEPC